jgi:hypothetical protein
MNKCYLHSQTITTGHKKCKNQYTTMNRNGYTLILVPLLTSFRYRVKRRANEALLVEHKSKSTATPSSRPQRSVKPINYAEEQAFEGFFKYKAAENDDGEDEASDNSDEDEDDEDNDVDDASMDDDANNETEEATGMSKHEAESLQEVIYCCKYFLKWLIVANLSFCIIIGRV